jgi:hypothetical protein
MAQIDVIVSVEESRLDGFSRIVKAMRGAGVRVEEEMAAVGVVAGRVTGTAEAAAGRRRRTGRSYDLAPPHSDVQ